MLIMYDIDGLRKAAVYKDGLVERLAMFSIGGHLRSLWALRGCKLRLNKWFYHALCSAFFRLRSLKIYCCVPNYAGYAPIVVCTQEPCVFHQAFAAERASRVAAEQSTAAPKSVFGIDSVTVRASP